MSMNWPDVVMAIASMAFSGFVLWLLLGGRR